MAEQMKTITATTPPGVPLGVASQQTAAWRNFIDNQQFKERAFFIRLEDILAALNLSNLSLPEGYTQTGLRLYMAMQPMDIPAEGRTMRTHLYVVGTTGEPTAQVDDIIGVGENTMIYDTTIPCPDLCSGVNVLNVAMSAVTAAE